MNDETGTRKASRRRRTTRRLMKHAARALGQATLEARAQSPSSVEITEPAANSGELTSHEDLSTISANEQLSELDIAPPAVAVEEGVKWSAEQSPLMAALSAAAEAGGQAWSARNAQDEPDTTIHTSLSRPPPALSEASTTHAFGVSGELLSSQPRIAAQRDEQAVSENGASFLVADEVTAPAAQADALQPSAADEAATHSLESGSYVEEKTQDLDIVADLAALSDLGQNEIADSDRPGAANRVDESEHEAKTKPKIRLPDSAMRRLAAKPPTRLPNAVLDSESAQIAAIRALSPVPPNPPGAQRGASPLPPAPDSARRAGRNTPTGEGIIRASQPPRPLVGQAQFRPDLESDVPTRPRIPLTHDMALAAGRVSTLGVQRALPQDVGGTSPRLWPAGEDGERPAVIVTRSQVISDHPPALYGTGTGTGKRDESAAIGGDFDVSLDSYVAEDSSDSYSDKQTSDAEQRSPLMRQRRPRPDSEEFETLNLDGSEEQTSRLEIPATNGDSRDTGVRVSRTPPPPPAQPNAKQRNTSAAMQQRPAPPPPPPGAAKKPAPAKKAQAKRRAWWEVLFSDDYVKTLPRPSQVLVAKQVSFMESSLGISRGDAVLDVGCGLGQHALEFARRGYLVVALDLALSMITRAAEEAQQHGLRINFLHKDIRDIGFEGTFDAIICVGTTFGFFDDEQNRGVLQRLAHALKPGGRLLLEVVNRDYVIGSQPNLVWFEGDGCVVMEESDFNFYSSRLNVKRTMMREDGRQTESEYSVRLYSVHELGQLLKQAGFGIKEVSGQEATRGLFFGSQSSRIIMLAERRSAARTRPESQPPESE